MGKLVLLLPDGTSLDIPLDRERVTIGRRPDNHVCLPYPAVSGEHAAVVTILDDSFLEDLNSTNGTLVNERPISKHFLRDGDVIDIGRQKLVYHSDLSLQLAEAIAPRKGRQPASAQRPAPSPRKSGSLPTSQKPPAPSISQESSESLIPRAFGDASPDSAKPERGPSGPPAARPERYRHHVEPGPIRANLDQADKARGASTERLRPRSEPVDDVRAESTPSIDPLAVSQTARLVADEPAPERHSLQLGRPLTLGVGLVVSTDLMPAQEAVPREEPQLTSDGQRQPAPPSVRILSGASTGRVVAMTRDELVIGRVGEAVAAIGRSDAGFRLLQLEGPGAVKVNEGRVTAGGVALRAGDTLELAGVRLVFSAGGETDQ